MDAPVGLALDRAGRFGCFSCDRLYNIFEPADPVAYMLNSTVDASLGRKIDPISIPSATQSTLDSVFGSFSEIAKSLPALPDLSSFPTPVSSLPSPLLESPSRSLTLSLSRFSLGQLQATTTPRKRRSLDSLSKG